MDEKRFFSSFLCLADLEACLLSGLKVELSLIEDALKRPPWVSSIVLGFPLLTRGLQRPLTGR